MSWSTVVNRRQSLVRRASNASVTSVNRLRVTSLVVEATKALAAAGFRGYDTPEKLTKTKSHLRNADDVSFLPDDEFVVADKKDGSLRIFDIDGNHRTLLIRDCRPRGVDANECGTVAYVDKRRKTVRVVASANGKGFSQWGEEINWDPYAIAWNNKGRLIVSDVRKARCQVGVYTVDGRCMLEFGKTGSKHDDFLSPWYLAVDPYDRLVVSDRLNHSVKIFDDSGALLNVIGGHGEEEGRFRYPRGVCTDSKGNLFVCDTGNKRVSVFSPDGRFLQHLLTKEHGLAHPFAIDLNRRTGRLIITQHDSDSAISFRKVRMYRINTL